MLFYGAPRELRKIALLYPASPQAEIISLAIRDNKYIPVLFNNVQHLLSRMKDEYGKEEFHIALFALRARRFIGGGYSDLAFDIGRYLLANHPSVAIAGIDNGGSRASIDYLRERGIRILDPNDIETDLSSFIEFVEELNGQGILFADHFASQKKQSQQQSLERRLVA
ncbi:MAG: hypothetical protein QW331_02150 [Candidatus Woesearchaeota archaeon]